MTQFSDDFALTPAEMLEAQFGSTATFKADGTGSGSTVTILLRRNQTFPGYYEDREQDVETVIARVAPADVSGYGLSSTFTIGSEVWAVVAIGRELPMVEFQIEHRTQVHVGGAGARIKR